MARPGFHTWLPACILLATAATPAGEPQPIPSANAIAVRVNARMISVREVESAFQDSFGLIQERLRKGELKPERLEAAIREAWSGAIQTTIQDALLDQLGSEKRQEIIQRVVARANPSVPSSRIMERFKRMEDEEVRKLQSDMTAAAGGEKEMRTALARRGQTMRDWETDLRREIFRRWVLFENVGPIGYSPAAARAYYDAHPEDFRRSDAWRLRRIRVPKARFSSAEAAAQAAELIHRKLAEGYDFGKLAEELKYDPPHDTRGGLLTVDGQTDLPSGNFPAEERIAAGLKDGELSKPADAGEAILIVKREACRPADVRTFEESAERAAALAFAERVQKKKMEFFEKQKTEAFVEILQPDPPAEWLKQKAP